jgi:hypothetical protein
MATLQEQSQCLESNVMINIFGDPCRFSAKKLAVFLKTTIMITFSAQKDVI